MSGHHVETISIEEKIQKSHRKHIFNLLVRFETELSKQLNEEYLKEISELFLKSNFVKEEIFKWIKNFFRYKRRSNYLTRIKKQIAHELEQYERRSRSNREELEPTTIFKDFHYYDSIYDQKHPKLKQILDKLEDQIEQNKDLKDESSKIRHEIISSSVESWRHIQRWWDRWDEYLSFQRSGSFDGFMGFEREREKLEHLYQSVSGVRVGENFSFFIYEDFIDRCQEEYDFRFSISSHHFFATQGVDSKTIKREYLKDFETFMLSMKNNKEEDKKRLLENQKNQKEKILVH